MSRGVCALAALALACTKAEPEGDPSLVIVIPAEGATVCGDPLTVEVDVQDFELVPLTDGERVSPGTGHVDVFLNGQSATMVSEQTFELDGVQDGEWQLKCELVNADHTALEPYVADLVYVTVDATVCGD